MLKNTQLLLQLSSLLLATFVSIVVISAERPPVEQEEEEHQEEQEEQEAEGNSLEVDFEQLREILAEISENVHQERAAWVGREKERLDEGPPPYKVRQLQEKRRWLEVKKNRLLRKMRENAELATLLTVLREADDASFAAALVPLAVEIGADDPRTAETFVSLARRLEPCPLVLVKALAEIQTEESLWSLVELGVEQRNRFMLVSAARTGHPGVLAEIIDIADGRDAELGPECLRVLRRLTRAATPAGVSESEASAKERELKEMLRSRIQRVQSTEVKGALIAYLGLFPNWEHHQFFVEIYRASDDEQVRIATLGALGNLDSAGVFLVRELSAPGNSTAIRRACIQAIGATRYRSACSLLVSLMSEPQLSRDAHRALRRIAGYDLGPQKAAWLRWCRLHRTSKRPIAARE